MQIHGECFFCTRVDRQPIRQAGRQNDMHVCVNRRLLVPVKTQVYPCKFVHPGLACPGQRIGSGILGRAVGLQAQNMPRASESILPKNKNWAAGLNFGGKSCRGYPGVDTKRGTARRAQTLLPTLDLSRRQRLVPGVTRHDH